MNDELQSKEICGLKMEDVDRRISEQKRLLYVILVACLSNPIIAAVLIKMMKG